MKHHCIHQTASALGILMAMIACVLPSQTGQPPSAMQPNVIATAVEGTAQAAAQQTAAAQPVPTRMTGTQIELLADGTSRYTDYEAGFEITYPPGWLAVRPLSEEFDAALAKEGTANSMLHDQMTLDVTQYQAGYDRLYVYILRPDIKKNVVFGLSDVEWYAEDTRPLDNLTMGELTRKVEASGNLRSFHADTAQIHEEGPVKRIEIGGSCWISDGKGGSVPYYATVIYFKPSPGSMVDVVFTVPEAYKAELLSDVIFITQSIRILE